MGAFISVKHHYPTENTRETRFHFVESPRTSTIYLGIAVVAIVTVAISAAVSREMTDVNVFAAYASVVSLMMAWAHYMGTSLSYFFFMALAAFSAATGVITQQGLLAFIGFAGFIIAGIMWVQDRMKFKQDLERARELGVPLAVVIPESEADTTTVPTATAPEMSGGVQNDRVRIRYNPSTGSFESAA